LIDGLYLANMPLGNYSLTALTLLTNIDLCSLAGKVTAGLAECNGSLPPGE